MARKRVEAEAAAPAPAPTAANTMVRGKDGSAFARCEECKKDVPVALIGMHSCSLEARIKMNLEAQVVEKPPADPNTNKKKHPAERKKSTSTEPKPKKAKKDNKPDKPKRPPTAFFLFLDDFRKAFKEANPGSKDVKRVAKEAGEKWKSMTDEEKKPYMDRSSKMKAKYDKAKQEPDNAEHEQDGEEGGSEKEDAEQEVQPVPDEE